MQSAWYDRDVAKTIQIRGVPEEVHRSLRVKAAQAGVSLSEFCLRELTEVSERSSLAEILREPLPGRTPTRDEIIEAIREGRRGRP